MAYGQKIASRAEADRQRQLATEKNEAEGTPADGGGAPSAPAARPTQGVRTGGFRPNRGTSRDQDQGSQGRPAAFGGLPVEDGIPSVQVIRRLLEVAVVERWPQTRVDNLERQAHEDPDLVWSQISSSWEKLSANRRAAAAPRDSAQVSFRIISQDGQVRPSAPTGPRAKTMALLHGLDLLRLPADRVPFSAEVLSAVQAEQRRLRQAAAQATIASSEEAVMPPVSQETSSAPPEVSEAPPVTGRWVRQARR